MAFKKKPFDKRFAWWYLSKRQKQQLRELRLAGEFGGTPGKAPYFWVQDGTTPEGLRGADEAGITPTGFMFDAESSFNAKWADVIDRVLLNAR